MLGRAARRKDGVSSGPGEQVRLLLQSSEQRPCDAFLKY